MAKNIQSVRGMHDILPSQSASWQHLESTIRNLFNSYSYRELRTPIIEPTELFSRGIGEVTDIVEKGIVLEVCPGSNVVLGAVPDWTSHPIEKLRDAGVQITVSTDDPPFFHTTMTYEYDMLAKTFGWGADDFAVLNKTALRAAYCDEATRVKIAKKLEPTP